MLPHPETPVPRQAMLSAEGARGALGQRGPSWPTGQSRHFPTRPPPPAFQPAPRSPRPAAPRPPRGARQTPVVGAAYKGLSGTMSQMGKLRPSLPGFLDPPNIDCLPPSQPRQGLPASTQNTCARELQSAPCWAGTPPWASVFWPVDGAARPASQGSCPHSPHSDWLGRLSGWLPHSWVGPPRPWVQRRGRTSGPCPPRFWCSRGPFPPKCHLELPVALEAGRAGASSASAQRGSRAAWCHLVRAQLGKA